MKAGNSTPSRSATRLVVTMSLTLDLEGPTDELAGAAGLSLAAAAEAERSFGSDRGPDGWSAYRAAKPEGPLAADLSELLAGALADAMPKGGYEIDDLVVSEESAR